MALNGQATGGWTESTSALRLLHVGVRNSNAELTPEAFTQSNPPIVTATNTRSLKVNTQVFGVLSGSVAFNRPDVGSNLVGGPTEGSAATTQLYISPVGVFINNATGYQFVNQPGFGSGVGPYVSAMGTYGNQLYETQALAAGTGFSAGDTITYVPGQELIASRNGYLMPRQFPNGGTNRNNDIAGTAAEVASGRTASTTIGSLRMVPDSVQNEIVFDQRI
jgi:hypothetical protein